MNLQNAKSEQNCLRDNIAAYIDGELTPREEMDFEMHLTVCEACKKELNEQKKMLCVLDFALIEDEKGFELPEDFTKVVVANAESKVGGLRCPRERYRTMFVCSALFLLVLLGLRGETGQVFETFSKFIDQIWVVGGFFAHLVYNISIGTTVILRSICIKFILKYAILLIALVGFLFTFSMFALSRSGHKFNRV
jgi:predicted anti-sigma-YlaC factor YlaD